MPQSTEISSGIQTSDNVEPFRHLQATADGFVVAPFDNYSNTEAYFIRGDIRFNNDAISTTQLAEILAHTSEKRQIVTQQREVSKAEYLTQAEALISKLRNQELKKVVLSRTINDTDYSLTDAISIYEKLTRVYPHAFVSIFFIPGKCCWIGATPETLLKAHSGMIETMSLAGTRPATGDTQWSEKEREEQQMVSDYVADVLRQFPFEHVTVEGPQDLIAGNVCHLMTKYSCKGALDNESLFQLVSQLHPTPAVCGLPKIESMKLIHQTELHDREYYAGYIGPVSEKGCDLFVNLRCMKLTDEGITLYVGGGITAQSVAEAEWQETCLKAETLLKIIKN